MPKAYDKDKNLIIEGTITEVIEALNISATHYYALLNGKATYLAKKANADILVVGNNTYEKAPEVKPEDRYPVGYKFNYKGFEVEITNIEVLEDDTFRYTFNDNFSTTALKPYENFNTMYKAVERIVNKK